MSAEGSEWIAAGKVKAREAADGIEIVIDGLTTQAKYYKPLVYEFMRKDWSSRPSYGDYVVEIVMEHIGDPPWMDLDNLAKALLDAIKGYLFHDDSQVARLLVERREGERERITIRVEIPVRPSSPSYRKRAPRVYWPVSESTLLNRCRIQPCQLRCS